MSIGNGRAAYITSNLLDVLRRLRNPDNSIILWADALCIDQNNLSERAEQVKLMGLIYWKARRIHVWLGRDDCTNESHNAAAAIHLIRELGQLYCETSYPDTPEFSLALYRSISELTKDGSLQDSNWIAMRLLLERSWFGRVWVVQELGLSRDATFYCGESSFTKAELDDFVALLETRGSVVARSRGLKLGMLKLANQYWSSARGNLRLEFGSDPELAESFLDILTRARGLQCTDQRDSIYAFLGHPAAFKQQLLDASPYMWYPRNYYNNKKTLIQPDYSPKNTFLDLYRHVAITYLENPGFGLEVLHYVAHDEHTIEADIPSWVPRWDLTFDAAMFYLKYFAASGRFTPPELRASYSSQPSGGHVLQLRATHLGHVDVFRDLTATPLYESLIILIAPSDQDPGKPIEFADTHSDALKVAITLTAGLNRGRDLLVHSAETEAVQHFANCVAFIRREEAKEDRSRNSYSSDQYHDVSQNIKGEPDHYEEDLVGGATNRTFFQTQDGTPGLGPRITSQGDEVWLPMGAKMPVMLRRLPDKTFKILGQAYLHGAMKGEAVEGLTAEDFGFITLV